MRIENEIIYNQQKKVFLYLAVSHINLPHITEFVMCSFLQLIIWHKGLFVCVCVHMWSYLKIWISLMSLWCVIIKLLAVVRWQPWYVNRKAQGCLLWMGVCVYIHSLNRALWLHRYLHNTIYWRELSSISFSVVFFFCEESPCQHLVPSTWPWMAAGSVPIQLSAQIRH